MAPWTHLFHSFKRRGSRRRPGVAVLVGLVIRLVVSSRQRPSEDASVPAQPQVPATGESPIADASR